jgi:SprA-related family
MARVNPRIDRALAKELPFWFLPGPAGACRLLKKRSQLADADKGMSVSLSTRFFSGISAQPRIAAPRRGDGPASDGGGSTEHPAATGENPRPVADTVVYFSPAARKLLDPASEAVVRPLFGRREDAPVSLWPKGGAAADAGSAGRPSRADHAQVEQLRARDTEVRVHEAAHAAAAGGLAGQTSLEYTTGPDGKRYAVGGEVSIDTSPGRTPEETVAKARTIRAAATAPANPSAQDLAVESAAAQMEADAQSAIQQRQTLERQSGTPEAKPTENRPPDAPTETHQERDPDMMLIQLSSEQTSARGGTAHSHSQGNCGFCRRAASAYG